MRITYYQKDAESPGQYNLSVREIKKLIKTQGGKGYIEHYDRDGVLFEVTEIRLSENNSSFKYNIHL